jgi:hypothetical protein
MNFTEIRLADEEGETWVVEPGTLFVSVDAVGNRHHTLVKEDISNGAVVQPWVDPATPYQRWHNEISKLDKDMPRTMEDILDGMPNKLSVAKITLDRLQAKKDLRATKP